MELACLYTANEDLQVKYLVYSLGENLCYQYFSQGTNIHNLQIIEKVNWLPPAKELVTIVLMDRQFSGETQLKSLKVFKIFLAIRDMDIKIIFWFRFTPVPKAVIK